MATAESRVSIVDIQQLSTTAADTAVNAAIEVLEAASFVVTEIKTEYLDAQSHDPKHFVTLLGVKADHLDSGGSAVLVTVSDVLGRYTAANVEAALAEIWALFTSPGVPMQSRLRALGAPAKLVQGDTITIGADVYEFRDDTPPTGGTAGRVWVYNGANSAASRANWIKAVNGVVDAALIGGAVATEFMLAAAGVTTGDVVVQSAAAVGGAAAPSATATATTEVLTTATDIWDHTTMQYGEIAAPRMGATAVVTLGAQELAKGDMQVYFDFTPTKCLVKNRSRPADEAYTISGNAVSLTLTGGGSPNHQSGDLIEFQAWE